VLDVSFLLRDFEQDGVRCLVVDGGIGLCAYVGVPEGHPIAGKECDDEALRDLEVHGGLTFAGEGDGKYRPTGWYWYGWDDAHAGDYLSWAPRLGGRRWTVDDVEAEVREAARVFARVAAEARS
jgi:hypothetical protein